MITKDDAFKIAASNIGPGLVILAEGTLELEFGWVFCYDSKEYIDTGDERFLIAGNAPIIVDRTDGSVHVTGTARPLEFYIENYRRTGSPHERA